MVTDNEVKLLLWYFMNGPTIHLKLLSFLDRYIEFNGRTVEEVYEEVVRVHRDRIARGDLPVQSSEISLKRQRYLFESTNI